MSENIVTRIKSISKQYPNNIALVYAKDSKEITYKDLDELTDKIATYLYKSGICQGDFVGVSLTNKFDWIITILSVLKIGAAYVPIDSKVPIAYMKKTLESIGVRFLISEHEHQIDSICEFDIERIKRDGTDLVIENIAISQNSTELLAYVMFTSGTTGTPKGVGVTHENIINLVVDSNYISLTSSTIMLQTGAQTFDACTFEVWGALLNGGELVLLDKQNVTDIICLKNTITKYKVSTMWLTAPLFNIIAEDSAETFEGIKEIIVGGDVVLPRYVNNVLEKCKGITVFNGYGPTECTTFSTTYKVSEYVKDDFIPIGKALMNVNTYVCNDSMQLVENGEVGELFIGGKGVAIGYLNNEELTKEVFIQNPFGAGRIYKTGDLVKVDDEGNIIFLGRKDRQVKINGFRIELAEVESILLQIPSVEEAHVLTIKDRQNKATLCAYVRTTTYTETKVREEFVKIAPNHISISNIVVADNTPLNNNGKVDYKIIKELFERKMENASVTKTVSSGNDNNNEILNKIIENRVGILPPSEDMSFFELGLDSLTAVYIAKDLTKRMNVKVAATDVLINASMFQLTKFIESFTDKNVGDKHDENTKLDIIPLVNPQNALFVDNIRYSDTTKYNIPIYIELGEGIELLKLENAIKGVISRHSALNVYFKMNNQDVEQKIASVGNIAIEFLSADVDIRKYIKPFNLEEGKLFRIFIGVDNNEPKWLMMDFHHIIMDGYSLQLIVGEIDKLYKDELIEEQPENYFGAISEYNNSFSNHNSDDLAFYKEYYRNYQRMEELPIDNEIKDSLVHKNKCYSFSIVGEVLAKFRHQCSMLNITYFEGFMYVYAYFLHLITGSQYVSFATPSRIYGNDIYEKAVGMFTDTLWVNKKITSGYGEKEDVCSFANGLRDLQNHRFVPINEISALRGADNDSVKTDTLVAYHTKREMTTEFLNSTVSIKPLSPDDAMFLINMQIFDENESVNVDIEYMSDAFEEETISSLGDIFNEAFNMFVI